MRLYAAGASWIAPWNTSRKNQGWCSLPWWIRNCAQNLLKQCAALSLPAYDVLEVPITVMREFLGASETHKPGGQHEVDNRYLDRIEALNFTIQHDDGQSPDTIDEAEVVLLGASRTSKTPTCVYLAIRGVRAANIPLVPGMPLPAGLLTATKPLIVGLWASPDRLVQVRRNRLATMGEQRDTNYVDLENVRAEIATTRQLYEKHDWPAIDVSRRSIEETASQSRICWQSVRICGRDKPRSGFGKRQPCAHVNGRRRAIHNRSCRHR